MVKGYFAGFQYCEFISGSVAAPTSPIPPPRESGAILSELTPVLIGLNKSFCPHEVTEKESNSKNKINIFFII